MLLVSLVCLIESTLKQGEDPYAILGVRRDASTDDIRAAFRKITLKHHPDVSKDESSTRIWMKSNDAYEILSDSKKRRFYDRTGSLSGDVYPDRNTYYRGFTRHMRLNTQRISISELKDRIKKDKDTLILIIPGQLTRNIDLIHPIEEAMMQFGEFIDSFHSIYNPEDPVIDQLNIKHLQFGIVYVEGNVDGKLKTQTMKLMSSDRRGVLTWIHSVWRGRFEVLSSIRKATSWMNKSDKRANILFVSRAEQPTLEQMKLSGVYSKYVNFAILNADSLKAVKKWKLTSFPSYVASYDGVTQTSDSLEHLLSTIPNLMLSKIDSHVFKVSCQRACVVYLGDPSNASDLSPEHLFWSQRVPSGFSPSSLIIVSSQSNKYINTTRSRLHSDLSYFMQSPGSGHQLPPHFFVSPPLTRVIEEHSQLIMSYLGEYVGYIPMILVSAMLFGVLPQLIKVRAM